MTPLPVFHFFLYDKKTLLHNKKKQWKSPLPLDCKVTPSSLPEFSITFGDYFKAVKSVLKKEKFEIIQYALFSILKTEIDINRLSEIKVILAKHGEFYHPAKIEVTYNDETYGFVMNVAVSSVGKAVIRREFGLLDELSDRFSNNYLPEVYGFGEALIEKTFPILMFLGRWFDGFHEFHATEDPDGSLYFSLWDTEKESCMLSNEEAMEIYRKIAAILTVYYDIHTFKQIFPWHHAAGDFVVNKGVQGITVKLITCRQYASMLENPENDPEFRYLALLVFLINLSIRMRLDRLDGVGDMVWLDDGVVKATLEGFFEGLLEQQNHGWTDQDFINGFKSYLADIHSDELLDIGTSILSSYDKGASELILIKKGLKVHMAVLAKLIASHC